MKTSKTTKRTVGRKKPPRRSASESTKRKKKSLPASEASILTVREALEIAIESECDVRDCYARGAQVIRDERGSKVFAVLAREEQGHVDYLQSRLAEWARTGKVTVAALPSILPDRQWVREAEEKHRRLVKPKRVAAQNELELLKSALHLEQQASTFYNDLVRCVAVAERPLFEQFLTIEEGHLALVQAELDSVMGLGYWFDVQEFALEAE